MDRGLWYCTGGNEQIYFKSKEKQEGRVVIWGSFTDNWKKKKKKKYWKASEKGKVNLNEHSVPENSKERQEGLLQQTMQIYGGKQQKGKD